MVALQNGLYPIKLFFSTVAALLHISSNHPEYSNRTTSAIYSFIEQTIEKIRDSTCKNLRLSAHFVAPDVGPSSPASECPQPIDAGTPWFLSCHKFYPLLLDAFPMGSSYHTSKSPLLLCSPGIIDRLNRLILDIVQLENTDADTLSYVQTLVARYKAQGRPLTGYFIVLCFSD